MTRRTSLGPTPLLALTLLSLLLCNNCGMKPENNSNISTPNASSSSANNANDPLEVHRRAISVDMHADTTQRLVDENLDISRRLADGHLDVERMKAGGLTAQFFSIWVEPQLYGGGGQSAIERADVQIAAVRRLAEKHPEIWEVALSAADVRRIAGEGKLAALMGLEGGYAIDERLEMVERYYKMGVRYMSPAWSVS
ncbi:MAG TPA: membrane dipeptidase, partial [Pyrinomonadaceae bacterium]|nr:membrane dipeptidase [Pyrinomonadaceae bacterium]